VKTSILSVVALAMAAVAWPLVPPALAAAPITVRSDAASRLTPVAVMVIHSKSHKGLPNMPLYIAPDPGGNMAWVGQTDQDGHALLALPAGAYTAFVVYGERVATVQFKVPAGFKNLIAVTIEFNPEG
jgi:hypothetical protein